jgi:hypothetical protein
LTEFHDAIRSPVTKNKYDKRLAFFFEQIGLKGDLKQQAKTFIAKSKADPVWATRTVNDYMRSQKERAERGEIAEATVPNFWKPIKLLLEQNDVLLNWRKISKRIPKGKSYGNDRLPKVDEIKGILSYTDRRIKPVILTMVSSGIRVGAWDYLNWGDVTPIKKGDLVVAARLKVYSGTRDEYSSFITPEAYAALKEYVHFRSSAGESITDSSPLVRDIWFGDRLGKSGHELTRPHRLASNGVKRLVEDAIKYAGLRKPLAAGKRRHEFQALHGFRKFFKSVGERKMKTLHVEILLGHSTGLNANYYRPTEEELLNDYLKAVPDLTMLEAVPRPVTEDVEVLKAQVAELQKEMKTYREFSRKFLNATPSQLEEIGRKVIEKNLEDVDAEEMPKKRA